MIFIFTPPFWVTPLVCALAITWALLCMLVVGVIRFSASVPEPVREEQNDPLNIVDEQKKVDDGSYL